MLLFNLILTILFHSYLALYPISIECFIILFSILWCQFFNLKNHLLRSYSKAEMILLFLSYLLIRLIYLFSDNMIDDDFYRYLWDGKMINENFTPYVEPPIFYFNGDQKISEKWDIILSNINHPHLPTIYLPVAQMLFFLSVYFFDNNIYGLKFILFTIEFILFIFLFIKSTNKNSEERVEYRNQYKNIWREGLFWLVLSPIFVFHFSHEIHIDILGILFLVLAYSLLVEIFFSLDETSSSIVKYIYVTVFSLLYVLSIFTKPFGLIIFPFIFIIFKIKKVAISFIVSFTISFVILFYPMIESKSNLTSVNDFYSNFEYNSSLFSILNLILKREIAEFIHIFIFAILYFIIFLKWNNKIRINKKSFKIGNSIFVLIPFSTIFAYLLLFGPIANPWYLCWVIPFLGMEKYKSINIVNKYTHKKNKSLSWIEVWLITIMLAYITPVYLQNTSSYFLNLFIEEKDAYSHNLYLQIIQFFPVYIYIFFSKINFSIIKSKSIPIRSNLINQDK